MQSRYGINHFNNWERIGELQNTVLERIRFGEAFCKTGGKQLSNVIIRWNETRGKTSEPFHLHNYPETIFTRKAFPFCYMWLLLNFTVAFFYYLFLFVCRSELWRQSVFFVSGFFSFPFARFYHLILALFGALERTHWISAASYFLLPNNECWMHTIHTGIITTLQTWNKVAK